MRLILVALTLWSLCAAPLRAACEGQDLAGTLTAAERATLERRLAATPYPEGNHWRATRDGEVLHLVGTVHIDDSRLDEPAARLIPLVRDAPLLLLEMTRDERVALERAMATRSDMLLLPDRTLPELLSEEDWNQLAEAMRARGLPPFMAAKMQPWYVSLLLSVPPCMTEQLADGNGLDARLKDAAETAGVPTRALEPFDSGFAAFTEMSFDMQLLLLRSALAAPDASEDLLETVLSAYFDETHGEGQIVLEVLSPRLTNLTGEETQKVFESMNEGLIARRNRAWIPVLLDALDTTEGTVVAAFGAAHLAGEAGVLQLLADEGFALERLPF